MLSYVGQNHSLQGKTLLLSGLGVAQLPALTLDHIIAGNRFKRIGVFASICLEAAVGYLPAKVAENTMGLPAELYMLDSVLIFQLRSRVRLGRRQQFVKEVKEWCSNAGIKDIVLITSLPVALRNDQAIQSMKLDIYYHLVKSESNNPELSVWAKEFKSIETLKDKDESPNVILKSAGLANQFNTISLPMLQLLVFTSQLDAPVQAEHYSRRISGILGFKELSATR